MFEIFAFCYQAYAADAFFCSDANAGNKPHIVNLLIGNDRNERGINTVLRKQFCGTSRRRVQNYLNFAVILPVQE